MRKNLMRAASLTCVAGMLLSGCAKQNNQKLNTVFPERGSVESAVEESGLASYTDPFNVIPLVSGRILSCSIAEGDRVEEGQELYVIDSSDLEDQITQARLSVKRAAETYRQAQKACDDLTVRSNASGAITALNVHVGDFVSMGTPVAEVTDSVNLKVTVPFAKEDAATFGPGGPASVSFSNYSGTLPATVRRVHSTSVALPGGREGVNVEIAFVNPGVLTAGTVATASVNGIASMDGGAVEYSTAQAIFATQSGQILTLPLKVGDPITAGQTVMTLENEGLTNNVANARLGKETAEVSLSQLVSKRSDFTIEAPAAGVVSMRNFKEGDFASTATPMATIVQEQSMRVNVPVDEVYIDRIWPGQSAEVTFTTDSGEQRTYDAQVNKVADTGITAGGVTDYPVELILEHTEGLKAGMNVTARIISQQKEDCLRIPNEAVRDGAVLVLRDGKETEIPVEVGIVGDRYTEIVSGLTETDEVILPQL